jgi:hypothetical protein
MLQLHHFRESMAYVKNTCKHEAQEVIGETSLFTQHVTLLSQRAVVAHFLAKAPVSY